jgi:DNA-binding response OmpR family regulator
MSGETILVVDDERNIVDLVKLYLANEGYRIEIALTGSEAVRQFRAVKPNLIVLDINLPEIDGYEVCRIVRKESQTPIIMLTARTDDVDKIVGLEIGADDYLAKPFNPRELVARIKAVLRRSTASEKPATTVIRLGNTSIDDERHEVKIGGHLVELRSKEYDLLKTFAQHVGLVLEREKLLNLVWGYEYFGDTRTVDVHVAHLRDRIAGSDLQVQTIRGSGYKMVLASEIGE